MVNIMPSIIKLILILLNVSTLISAEGKSSQKWMSLEDWKTKWGSEMVEIIQNITGFKDEIQTFLAQTTMDVTARRTDFIEKIESTRQTLDKIKEDVDTFKNDARTFSDELSTELGKFSQDVKQFSDGVGYPPVNYVYIQYHLEKPPTELWPFAVWKIISDNYAGLFFRAEGGESAKFNETQGDNTRAITHVGHMNAQRQDKYSCTSRKEFHCSRSMGAQIGFEAKSDWGFFMGFKSSSGEVRPQNAAVRIWKRMR